MSLLNEYLCGAVELRILVRDARDKVMWAATPVPPGMQVKEQIYRAWEELRRSISHGLVKAAWYEEIGPYQWPPVHNSWLELVKRRAEVFQQFCTPEQQAKTPWMVHVNEQPVPILTRSQWRLAPPAPRRKVAPR